MKLSNLDWHRLAEMVRFYQAAIVNTAFGISAYMLLVWLGVNLFVAQAISHVMGVAFNYFTYSRHVFKGSSPAKVRFILSYTLYYFMNLGMLYLVSRWIRSPYVSGITASLLTSVINYIVLKLFVFNKRIA